ncbi:MAG: diadenylate cyclase CdaA [Eubacteriales bacterium]|nr:diadenylate cyclase CdaA [Eubacteriales bacterium]
MTGVLRNLKVFYNTYFSWIKTSSVTIAGITVTDVVEIAILSFLVYHLIVWLRATRAWTLMKGILFLAIFIALAYIFQMDTITFLIDKGLALGMTTAIIVFQPELRRALEQLGEKRFFSQLLPIPFENSKEVKERFSDKTINELVKACVEMGKAKTGALIVIEQNTPLAEYERTGIALDSIITSQLLINIFEHNTPLHDGAVLVRGDRIVSATCYLPLSDNMELSKELGTRHRAGVGISEVTDSVTIIVSEETGRISIASKGKLMRNINAEELRKRLVVLQDKSVDTKKFRLWKGKGRQDEKAVK